MSSDVARAVRHRRHAWTAGATVALLAAAGLGGGGDRTNGVRSVGRAGAQRAECHRIGAAVRTVADVLTAPSARAGDRNVPLFPDRVGGERLMRLYQARAAAPPAHLQ